jgi:hypothetical protein
MSIITQTNRNNGNGNGYHPPLSRKNLLRGLPSHIESVEDRLDDHKERLEELTRRVNALEVEVQPQAQLADVVGRLVERLRRIDRRSLRLRRKLAVVVDHVESQLE